MASEIDRPPAAPAVRGGALRIQILGPLRLWRGQTELDTGPRQQAYLLALLAAHPGLPVSKSELVDLIWGDAAPDSALNVIHKYVGVLRRLLEPTLPSRGQSSYLVRRGGSYLCTAGSGTLDLATFRDLVASAQSDSGDGRPEDALDAFERALRLWHGSAGDGLALRPDAVPVFAGLNNEFFGACTAAADLAVAVGQPERVLAPLRLAASMGPLHEPVHASLITILGAAGQQAEALSVYQSVRTRLVEELGIDPGPLLELAHQQVLRQDLPAGHPTSPDHAPPARAELVPPLRPVDVEPVGRAVELTALRDTVSRVAGGATGLVVLEGEPGVGKTRLLEQVAGEAGAKGCLVAWGRSADREGAPSMWPWLQTVRAILEDLPEAEQRPWLTGALGELLEPHDAAPAGRLLPGGSGQFRLFENVVALFSQVSARRPVIVVLDDLQWADTASLHLFAHLATRMPSSSAILAAVRDHAPVHDPHLARALATASRSSAHRRLRLGPLGVDDVAELVRREIGRPLDPQAVRTLHTRTAGNPFFVREVARLLGDDQPVGKPRWREGVPTSVRDVVRDRLTDLDADATVLLETAALIGRDVDLNLLARVADLDLGTCMTRLEPAEALSLLTPTPSDPCSVRFVHDLVRESISEAISPRHATRLHLRVADALEHMAADGEVVPERVAHHLWAAGPLAEPGRTADALVRSGRRAAARSALEAAEQQLRLAAQVSRSAGLTEAELAALTELTAVIGMRSMYAGAERGLLERAEHLARTLGREVEAAGILYSRWASFAQGIHLDQTGPLARQLLMLGESSDYPIVRTYGLQAWGIHQWDIGNIGEAFRYLSRSEETLRADWVGREENPVQYDLQLLMTGLHAETTVLHGNREQGLALLDRLETAGPDPYTVTVWATMSARIAVLIGDPVMALDAAERGITADPDYSYAFLGTYQRLARCWARAVAATEPAAAAGAAEEAERIIETRLCNPVRSCVSTWYGLLAEMLLAAGDVRGAAEALDRADHYLHDYGQRYAEGLLLLLRARLLRAEGKPAGKVRAAVLRARDVALAQEAYLFVQRADDLLARWDSTAA
ncbi:ATP-binding protein [Promicromonospora sp. NPDC052451]|uniref:ATP-binding protein n=1 Tax=Promicromonospora sp. NPDC052451 TaxID=3364407 RepID=UPI0037CA9C8A